MTMPYAGEIRAVSLFGSANRSAGTLTITAKKNNVETALTAVLSTATNKAYGTTTAGSITFAAGDTVGLNVTTDGSWAPTTFDMACAVWVTYSLI
jgi:hypothetical protein